MPMSHQLASRIGAHVLHSRYDSRETTANGRAKFLANFERVVDPDGSLDPDERARRARHAMTAHFIALAAKSAASRRRGLGRGA